MGRPSIGEIELLIEYDAGGNPKWFRYHDGEGCGHESGDMDPNTTVLSVIRYHLGHCKKSHGVELTPMCSYQIHPKNGGSLTCKLERHGDDTRHQFEL